MSTLVESVNSETVLLSCLLKADAHKSPFLMDWVRHHGQLPSAVLAQLAEAGIPHGVDRPHLHPVSPTNGVDQHVLPAPSPASVKIRVRTILHPLAHPRLIQHVHGAPSDWLRVTLLHAIEMGLQMALGARGVRSTANEFRLDSPVVSATTIKPNDAAVKVSSGVFSAPTMNTACIDDMSILMLGDLTTLLPTNYD